MSEVKSQPNHCIVRKNIFSQYELAYINGTVSFSTPSPEMLIHRNTFQRNKDSLIFLVGIKLELAKCIVIDKGCIVRRNRFILPWGIKP